MVEADTLQVYLDNLLRVTNFKDYCPNGLQVQGRKKINRLISGVTACQDLIEEAAKKDADAILVHHGYFWQGEDLTLSGIKFKRVKKLLDTGINLFAYHLPLDAHPELGNNAQLAIQLNLKCNGWLDEEKAQSIAMYGEVNEAINASDFAQKITTVLKRKPLWINGGAKIIRSIGWCTGAAQHYIKYAVKKNLDAFISGEISEQTTHIAKEEGIHYFAAGHHATERYGVQALANHVAQEFSLEHFYIDIDNPV